MAMSIHTCTDHRKNNLRWSVVLLVVFSTHIFFCTGCNFNRIVVPLQFESQLFEDATQRLGIDFVHDCSDASDHSMVRIMGSGCAIFDADGDGRPDILLLQNAGPQSTSKNKLYRQSENGEYIDVSAGSGLDFAGHNMGVAVGDIDGDGRPDVLITQYRGVKLFRNLGGCRFLEISTESGIVNPYWGTSASFFDYDRDGRLDIVIVNYITYDPKLECLDSAGKRDFCGPSHFPNSGSPIQLFRNLGTDKQGAVKFENVSQYSGVGRMSSPGLGVYCCDLTDDGWPDIFVTNDAMPNHLWVNQKDGTFREEAVLRGLAFNGDGKTAANMGIAVGDVDGDGMLDLFVTHLTIEMNTLWKQGPAGRFSDRTLSTSAVATKWRGTGFGTIMADFDLDGWPDIAIANGRVHRGIEESTGLPPFWNLYGERNQILRNNAGKFADVSIGNPAFCNYANVARGLAVGDINGDGRPDLLVNSIAGPAKVFLNNNRDRQWLAIRPLMSNGQLAYGAEVRIVSAGRTQLRVMQPTDSYLSSSNPELLFGMGEAKNYEEIRVRWPDGKSQSFAGGPCGRRMDVRQTAN